MWVPTTRRQRRRAGLLYETDLTDTERAVSAPRIPAPCGRPPIWITLKILNTIFDVHGSERQPLVYTDERVLILEPHPACITDRDGAGPVLRLSLWTFAFIAKAFANARYPGDRLAPATIITVDIARPLKDLVGFTVYPRRRVVDPSKNSR